MPVTCLAVLQEGFSEGPRVRGRVLAGIGAAIGAIVLVALAVGSRDEVCCALVH